MATTNVPRRAPQQAQTGSPPAQSLQDRAFRAATNSRVLILVAVILLLVWFLPSGALPRIALPSVPPSAPPTGPLITAPTAPALKGTLFGLIPVLDFGQPGHPKDTPGNSVGFVAITLILFLILVDSLFYRQVSSFAGGVLWLAGNWLPGLWGIGVASLGIYLTIRYRRKVEAGAERWLTIGLLLLVGYLMVDRLPAGWWTVILDVLRLVEPFKALTWVVTAVLMGYYLMEENRDTTEAAAIVLVGVMTSVLAGQLIHTGVTGEFSVASPRDLANWFNAGVTIGSFAVLLALFKEMTDLEQGDSLQTYGLWTILAVGLALALRPAVQLVQGEARSIIGGLASPVTFSLIALCLRATQRQSDLAKLSPMFGLQALSSTPELGRGQLGEIAMIGRFPLLFPVDWLIFVLGLEWFIAQLFPSIGKILIGG